MKLLIVTQKVDRTDPILGFFHSWVEGLSKRAEHVTVIGQFVADHTFPSNVTVLSLGKEDDATIFAQIFQFWKLIIRYRDSYDRVLVHMVPIWVVLGGKIWLSLRKPMYLWYEARGKRWPLRVALHFVRKVFSASPHGMPLRTAKSVITGHGIDTDHFRPGSSREPKLLLTVGRITRAKRLDVLIDALQTLGTGYWLRIIGGAITGDDRVLEYELREDFRKRGLAAEMGPLEPEAVVPLLQRADVFLHASETSLDKAVLEAMACGCPVVSTSAAFKDVLPIICQATDSASMANHVGRISAMSPDERKGLSESLRKIITEKHSLTKLLDRLVKEMA
ncbi:glycosyltransferase family 4 protein [Candidatus Peregrinibacteria bacterium]|nr:glycosyltransferase family 4 protein [Candidatus Peregrinibacteria bacterium]